MSDTEQINLPKDNVEETGKQAALLSMVEIGLGSLLHSFRIPLAGHILSINQTAIISRACFKLNSPKASLQISIIASLLKSLSPSGKKLTPMLAILSQGLLYYLGIFFFGINYLGLFFAVTFASLWAFLQPVILVLLIFGENSISVLDYFLRDFNKLIPNAERIIIWIVIISIIIKILAAFIISIIAIKMSAIKFEQYQQKLILKKVAKHQKSRTPAMHALNDLLNPLFLVSFAMTIFYFLFSLKSSNANLIWSLLRPLALGYLLFYSFRVFPVQKMSLFLHHKGFNQLGKMLDIAIKVVNETRGL